MNPHGYDNQSLASSALARMVTMLSTRPAVARSSGGKSPNSRPVTSSRVARLERLDELLAGVQDDLLAPLSPGERDQLARLLSRVLDHHGGT
jgi:MarR family transcriptional regulator, lower aerobic nicotinate degradation pathway regulator